MSGPFALRFMCHTTGNAFDHPSRADFEYVRARWEDTIGVFCPLCRRVHRYRFKDGYIESRLAVETIDEALRRPPQ
jgi:uncharacterized Zn-finger protein